MSYKGHILWADDEIKMLKPHILYLEDKGYKVTSVSSGKSAIELCENIKFDIVLLDEMMPGLDGLATLKCIKDKHPKIPIIMITKNEEEWLMEEAIAIQITHYLTKPVNPSQIFIACKNVLESNQIQSDHVIKDYLKSFQTISQDIDNALVIDDWYNIVDKLTDWSINFDKLEEPGIEEMLIEQWTSANILFSKFIENNYSKWLNSSNRPIMSPDILSNYIQKHIANNEKVFFIVMDCLRVDQFKAMSNQLNDIFDIDFGYYLSIIPTATPYSRNSIFSGLFPLDLQKKYPKLWNEMWNHETSMNQYENIFLNDYLKKNKLNNISSKFHKIISYDQGLKISKRINEYKEVDFITLVVNFVDILGHARSDSKILRELVPDETGYRNIICNWAENAWLIDTLKQISHWGHKVFLTSDHGSIKVTKPIQVKGDRDTSTGVRYKYGRNLNISNRVGITINDTESYLLPHHDINTNYIVSKGENYFVYPNDYKKFKKKFNNSFQHGGVSLEEMIIPIVELKN